MSTIQSPSPPLKQAIQELRRSSRLLVRVLGFMKGRFDGVDCTAAQCHALMELSDHGLLTVGELAELLEIDKSTASRSVRPLIEAGFIETAADKKDGRTKPLRLSQAGRAKVREIHCAADAQVRSALELLSEDDRGAVLRGVSLYERALHRARGLEGIVVRPIEARDDPEMASIIHRVMAEFGAVGSGFSSEDPEVDAMHAAYGTDRCVYFVAERNAEVIAGGGIAPLVGAEQDDICELRKMYALPEARGLGLGRLLLERCLDQARSLGFKRCYIETLGHMHRARSLYEKFGFRALDSPLGNTGHFGCNGWYILEL